MATIDTFQIKQDLSQVTLELEFDGEDAVAKYRTSKQDDDKEDDKDDDKEDGEDDQEEEKTTEE